jgi:two-component system, NtrC family, nitrogen regulation sensor histidine kinase NtrY
LPLRSRTGRLWGMKIFSLRGLAGGRGRLDDLIFLIGVFLFSSVLILGLFPRMDTVAGAGKSMFLYSVMAVPIIAAIYFIIISFRRKLAVQSGHTETSIRFKIAIAFVFIAILPSLPIVLISNNIITHMVGDLISEKTAFALEESLRMSKETLELRNRAIRAEIATLEGEMRRGFAEPVSTDGRARMASNAQMRGYMMSMFYVLESGGLRNRLVELNAGTGGAFSPGIKRFFEVFSYRQRQGVYSVSIGENSLLVGALPVGNYLIAMYTVVPPSVFSRVALFQNSISTYRQREYLKPYFQTGIGIFLLILSIIIVLGAIFLSMWLSKNITKPVLELEEAARTVAGGDFSIVLTRDSKDELALLFDSFNTMVSQLEESRRILYHTQKLEAWREVARKLVHEIKNPLTPIRLSAERIQKRYLENRVDIGEIVLVGTNTIIEEVNVLMKLLSEFSRYARLPEINAQVEELHPIIESCVNFFHGHEKVVFRTELSPVMPRLLIDRVLMRQALTNILQNAIDAIGGEGEVVVRTWIIDGGRSGPKACIGIRDNGPGIATEDLEKVFEPTFSTKASGTGLGLTIVEKIILEHKGRVSCTSRPGDGTEFIIELPITTHGA